MTPQQVTDLRDFVALLEERDELRRIAVEVDTRLEIAAITDRVCKGAAGRRALLFEKVCGHSGPVLTNLFGSSRRAAWMVGYDEPDQLRLRLADELARHPDGSAAERLSRLLAEPAWQPRVAVAAPCRENLVAMPDLRCLPALHCWPGDGGRFLTQPLVFTCDPDTGQGNCGMYRMQVVGRTRATLRWRSGSDAARHRAAWEKHNRPMPVAIALGGDPAVIYAASAPLPEGADELRLAGLLRRGPLNMVPCQTSELQVPANAEFIIEGVIHPGQSYLEGPFGNHRGCYDAAAPAPLLEVTALSHRSNPLFPATVAGSPPMESGYLAQLSERLLLALLQIDFPAVVDMHMPLSTIFHGVTLLAVRSDRADEVDELTRALWTRKPFAGARLLVFFDEQTDVRDAEGCFWRAVNRLIPERDLLRDGDRLAIDATRLPGKPLDADAGVSAVLEQRWAEYGLDP